MKTRFTSFHEAYPPDANRKPYVPARHDRYAAVVPPEIVEEWRAFGFGSYGGGLLWTPLPDEPFLAPREWRTLDGTGVEILRTAFADFIIWQGGTFRWLNTHSGRTLEYSPNPDLLFDSMTEKPFRRAVLFEPMFHRAKERLGDLALDETFGFAPLPALGGAMEDEYVVKVKLREYLVLAAQVRS